jgi:16S rRNA G966 N2-methylase RsmD
MRQHELTLKLRPLGELVGYAKNARTHSDAQVAEVAASISEYGFTNPVLIDETGSIIAGHGRVLAARKLGLEAVPTLTLVGLTETQKRAYRLADNRFAEKAGWDTALVLEELEALKKQAFDIALAGWSEDDLAAMLEAAKVGQADTGDEDEVPEPPVDPVTKLGDVWLLGPHRLVCGDACDAAVVDRALEGAVASAVFTDPPYGMSYKGTVFGREGLENDGDGEWEAVLRGASAQAQRVAPDAVHAYCFGAARLDRFFACLGGLVFHRLLTIYKPNRVAKPWRGWIMTSEHIALFSSGAPTWVADKHCHDVYTHDYSERPDKSVDHPTVKPLSIVVDVLGKTSKRGAHVFDPFVGSGTTLVAAEKLGRIAHAVELSPAFCDCVVARWEKLTGGKATRRGR